MLEPTPPPAILRVQTSLLASAERSLLTRLCRSLPRWVTPDHLTALGLGAAILILGAYAMSRLDPTWLWLAVLGYALNWFGDSLDGTLARHRRIERPAYGYFIDHSSDGLATLLILTGMGLSPYVRLDVALFAAAAYLLLLVHTFLAAKVVDILSISQAGMGPTELRLALIALTLAMYFLGPDRGRIGPFGGYDLIVGAAACILLAVFIVQTLKIGRRLLKQG